MNLAILRAAWYALLFVLAYLWLFEDAEGPGNFLTGFAIGNVIFGVILCWVSPAPYEYGIAYHVNRLGLIFVISWAGSLVLAVLLCVTYILRLAALIFYKEVQNAERG